MTALYSTTQIRRMERAAYAELAPGTLMQRAGAAACKAALALLSQEPAASRILVLAGPGNNGGDALVTAAQLAQQGLPVTVLLHADPGRYSAEAGEAYRRAKDSTLHWISDDEDIEALAQAPWSLVIDGLFGIGLQRP